MLQQGTYMPLNKKNISFSFPTIISMTGILLSILIIGAVLIAIFERNILEDNHKRNSGLTYNIAVNYTGSSLREIEFILTRAANYYSSGRHLQDTIEHKTQDTQARLMQLLTLMPAISSITLIDNKDNYVRVPVVSRHDRLSPETTPWLRNKTDSKVLNEYTNIYKDTLADELTVAVYRPLVSVDGEVKGILAFKLDLPFLSSKLRQMRLPLEGEIIVINHQGNILLNANTDMILSQKLPGKLLSKIPGSEGYFFDDETQAWYYTYSLTNPDWVIVYKIRDQVLRTSYQSEKITFLLGGGLMAIMTLVFGFYLRNAYRTILLNILGAIQTGDIKNPTRLESLLSTAIRDNKERENTLLRESTLDALTNCKNRRSFDLDIAALITQREPFSLGMIDIDNFKSINDYHGHLVGDIVLRNVAREGLNLLQPHDFSVYRYGGEEFVVLFTGDNLNEAHCILDEWRRKVESREWREKDLAVTFSGGLGKCGTESAEELISRVDRALYQAKKQGKNRITISNSNE